MKASQFSDAQKAFILKQGDEGVSAAEHRVERDLSCYAEDRKERCSKN